MVSNEERNFKNTFLNNTYPGLDLEVDDSGKVSDVEFPDNWTPEDTHKILCKLLTEAAERNYGAHLLFGI